MNITDKLIELDRNDPIVHNIISEYVAIHRMNYPINESDWNVSIIRRVIKDFREKILFDVMMLYKRMLDDKDKFIRKILEESQTPIIIDKENFIKLSKKEEKRNE